LRQSWHKLISKWFLAFIFLFGIFSVASYAENLLKNGDFSEGIVNRVPKYWGTEYYNNSLISDRSPDVLKISNPTPKMSLGAQEFLLDGNKIRVVAVSAWVKAEDVVPGVQDWNKANLQILFFDKKGVQLGGWPELGKWEGTFGWKNVIKNFIVPRGTVKAKVVLGLYDCTGVVYFDDISVTSVPSEKSTDPYNLLQNGGFEIWDKWAYGGSTDWGINYESAMQGNGSLRINNNTPVWSFASQSVSLDGKKVKKIKLSGYVKANNIKPGVKPWQLARVNIEFKDGKGKRIGGWPILEAFSGTFDWKYVEKDFDVPPDTKRVDVFAGLLECSGEAWFDGLRLLGYDNAGKPAKPHGIYITNTKGWSNFKPSVNNSKTVTDVSFLLDAPAGKHGFLKIKDGHFYFEDGTRARFWGVNVYAPSTFLSKADAAKMAARLAKNGCNLVRIHHIDAFWSNPNIFDPSFNDTQHLSAESLDKLDYFIYELKKRGIYVFMDLLVDREFKEGDNVTDWKNVERGAKISGFFDPKVIELQKIYAKQLLTHVNPYTKLAYVDDPVMVSAKLINEAMLFYLGTQFNISPYYANELDKLFNNWLVSNYGGRDNLDKAWTDRYGRMDLGADEDPRKGTVKRADIPLRYQRTGAEKKEPLRLADTLKFYEYLQDKYFKEMEGYLKSIGVKVPISGSNHWVNLYVDVKSNANLDYIDRHRYWDHPQFGYGTQVVFENQSMVKNPADALPNNFAFYKVKDKPFVVSEWNACFPNEYRVEGPLMMAAYANLQDWDGVIQFSFNHADWTAPMEDNFDISAWPNVLSQWPAAALLFYRGDVAEARGVLDHAVTQTELYGPLDEDKPIMDSPLIPYITKTMINFGSESKGVPDDFAKYHDVKAKKISSDNGELKLDYGKGVFTINTYKTQAAVGFMKGQTISLGDITVKSNNLFSSIALSSLDNQAISASSKLLLTVSARIENKDQKYNESKTQLENVGTAPLLVEPVSAQVTLKRVPKSITALDINGLSVKTISVRGNSFTVESGGKIFFYNIEF